MFSRKYIQQNVLFCCLMIISAHTDVIIGEYLLIYLNTLYHTFLKRSVRSGASLYAVIQKKVLMEGIL
jgi:hypothetical protein